MFFCFALCHKEYHEIILYGGKLNGGRNIEKCCRTSNSAAKKARHPIKGRKKNSLRYIGNTKKHDALLTQKHRGEV